MRNARLTLIKHGLIVPLIMLTGLLPAQEGLIIQENAPGVCTMDGLIETDAAGYTGEGYANIDNGTGVGMSWAFDVPVAGTYTFYCRYALGGSDETSRDAEVFINNVSDSAILAFPHISPDWDAWSSTDTLEIELEEGKHTIRLAATTEKGLPNIDYFHIQGSSDIVVAECTPSYTFHVTTVNADWGSVSYEPIQALYEEGTAITVSAEPEDGYFFHSWSGQESSIDSNFTFTITQNTDLTALFYPNGTTMDEDATGYATVQHDNGTPYLLNGGSLGDTVRVDNLEDLQHYLSSPEPYVVILTGPIRGATDEEIKIASHKTWLGEDSAHIEGIMVSIQEARNVIIRDMTFSKVVRIDELEITSGSQNIWIDHCEFFTDREHEKDYYDGLMDIKNEAKYITVSWSTFHDHEKCILISSGDQEIRDSVIRVSFHHNHFFNAGTRLPSIRFGKAHIFNNFYENIDDGINSRMNACVRVEKNFFRDAGTGVSMKYSPIKGAVELIDNIFENTGYFDSPDCELHIPYAYEALLVEPETLPDIIPSAAGPRILGSHSGNPVTVPNVNDPKHDPSMIIYPNPAQDHIELIINTAENDLVEFSITDISGKTTYITNQYGLTTGEHTIRISIQDLQPGLYLGQLKMRDQTINKKLLVR